jgi:hypothetical protein
MEALRDGTRVLQETASCAASPRKASSLQAAGGTAERARAARHARTLAKRQAARRRSRGQLGQSAVIDQAYQVAGDGLTVSDGTLDSPYPWRFTANDSPDNSKGKSAPSLGRFDVSP